MKKKSSVNWRIVVTAIIVIGGLEAIALQKGFDGTILTLAIGAIAGLAGWTLPQLKVN